MTSTKPPDPTTSLIFFVVLTSIFIVAKYFVTKITVDPCPSNIQNLSGSFTMTGAYILLLILGNYFINLNVTTAICGEVQWKNTFITTVIPWVLIFGTMNLLLTIYPGWLSPFSNTIGYLVAKLMGLEETVEAILKPNFIKGENVSSAAQKNIGEALEHIYSDKSLIINEITENNFCTFWDNMNAAGLFDTKKGATLENKIDLFNFIKLKDAAAQYIWFILSGCLVTSIGYNYIINTECSRSLKQMEQEHEKYIDTQAKLHDDSKKKKERIYTYE